MLIRLAGQGHGRVLAEHGTVRDKSLCRAQLRLVSQVAVRCGAPDVSAVARSKRTRAARPSNSRTAIMFVNQGPLVIRHLIPGARTPASAATAVPITPLTLVLASRSALRMA